MKATETFKTIIEQYLNETAQKDTNFAPMLKKECKNFESCINYIFAEVKKTGECAFADQEIYAMAVQYYCDDSITAPEEIKCKTVVNQPLKADLFTTAPQTPQSTIVKTTISEVPKKAQTTLTLFDL
jgi:hypothetical protein